MGKTTEKSTLHIIVSPLFYGISVGIRCTFQFFQARRKSLFAHHFCH